MGHIIVLEYQLIWIVLAHPLRKNVLHTPPTPKVNVKKGILFQTWCLVVFCVLPASVRSIFIRSRFPLKTRPDTQDCGNALYKSSYNTLQIPHIGLRSCTIHILSKYYTNTNNLFAYCMNIVPKTKRMFKYNEKTIQISHKSRQGQIRRTAVMHYTNPVQILYKYHIYKYQ